MKRSGIVTIRRTIREPETGEKPVALSTNSESPVESKVFEEVVAISGKTLAGRQVVDAEGNKIGKIEDVVIDMNTGCTVYAVLSFGGIFGSKYFAIPWEIMCLENRWNYRENYGQKIVLNIPKKKLEKAPGFDKNRWPDHPDKDWLSQVYSFYSCKPFWAQTSIEQYKVELPGKVQKLP
jgi:hypothetical protein